MDAPEPDTPFAAVSAQTTRFQRVRVTYEHFSILPFEHLTDML